MISAIAVYVDEIESGRSAPVAEQPGLDVFELQRLAQQRIVKKIDLPDGKIVGRAPIGVHPCEFFAGQRLVGVSDFDGSGRVRDGHVESLFPGFHATLRAEDYAGMNSFDMEAQRGRVAAGN